MEARPAYTTNARQTPECKDHPGKPLKTIITPELMHYGKHVCSICDKFVTWLATPEGVKKQKPTYTLGGVTFDAKTQLNNYVKQVLANATPGAALEGESLAVVRDLLTWHPEAEQKIGCGVAAIEVRLTPDFGKNTRGFWLVRDDGTDTDFSYRKCVDSEQSYRKKFLSACRFSVKDHITEFKEEFFRVAPKPTCGLSGVAISPDNSHVDHTPPYTFDRIVQAFVTLNALDMDDPALTMGGVDGLLVPLFASPTMRDRFVAFHNNYATLRVISPFANTSIVPKSLRESGVLYVN